MEAECEPVPVGDEEEDEGVDEAMLWSFQEALERQTLQIGASACGPQRPSVDVAPEEADRCVKTRLRRNEAPLPDTCCPGATLVHVLIS
ncbi:hypothetical protein F7725_008937 [Dissostichus mawsoni]|uniref:Uncharacterized protein n=1 Tax=Dissostichus mawsoni TaxID=36200 RepID=A0A7J5Z9Q5_DISMA|nr:hypothetical protein F7725_008937 [Dissostichus mawsoni]